MRALVAGAPIGEPAGVDVQRTESPSAGAAGTAWFADRLAGLAGGLAEGRATVVERSAPAESMPPLHTRDRDESYLVLEGEIVFHVGGETVQAAAGDAVVAPRGVERTFRVVSERARWLVLTAVRSAERYADFLRAVARPVEGRWPSPDEHAALTALAAANGIAILGPPGSLPRQLA